MVLLVHGFGASVYHWRYNVPELAKSCRVYALDCLGFGWSEKPVVQYDGYSLWSDQIAGGQGGAGPLCSPSLLPNDGPL